LSISQGGLMNMLRRAQERFVPGRDQGDCRKFCVWPGG
jgi:hypothetical protein